MTNMGWICPRCNAALAPSVQRCACLPISGTVMPRFPSIAAPMPGCGCTGPCGNVACPHAPKVTCGPLQKYQEIAQAQADFKGILCNNNGIDPNRNMTIAPR